MPGILPMKVIKVGTSAQSRIAQACDRCRSKKIRCDGVTPCCSQCANVGFDCKTSDKLSRRAFPRGYTESLEERVRNLEAEVKDLKNLLDEKDEKIDILSKIHSNSPSVRLPSITTLSSTSDATEPSVTSSPPKEEKSTSPQPPGKLAKQEESDTAAGASSGKQFICQLKAKIQENGKPTIDFKTEAFFEPAKKERRPRKRASASEDLYVPPRIVSDQMINIFFQEWAPLFPVIHRPTFLQLYGKYVIDPECVNDRHDLAKLYLVLAIAALSNEWSQQEVYSFDPVWQTALESIKNDNTLATLQCLSLAQIHSIAKGDSRTLQHYRGMAVTLSQRLGLHRSHIGSTMDALTIETMKKVFWTLYTLDCFCAAQMGLPKLFKEEDINAELPADVDDENVSEHGLQSTLPGEATRLSSALALFRSSRILSKVLDDVYTTSSPRDVPIQKLGALNEELDGWLTSLPVHLRLQFAQDKPSHHVIGSRSPFLSLVYHYIRTLIFRPAAGSGRGKKASSAIVALAQSSKRIVQIFQLLEERRMSFSFCLKKDELLVFAGFGLLYQSIDLDQKGKLIQDSQRLICSVISMLESMSAPGANDFKKVACAMISIDRPSVRIRPHEEFAARRKSEGTMPAPQKSFKSGRRMSTITNCPPKRDLPNSRVPVAPSPWMDPYPNGGRSSSQQSLSSVFSDPTMRRTISEQSNSTPGTGHSQPLDPTNLDYLDFTSDSKARPNRANSDQNGILRATRVKRSPQNDVAAGTPTFVDNIFPSPSLFSTQVYPDSPGQSDWTSDLWTMSANMCVAAAPSQSVQSLSDEDLTHIDDPVAYDLNGSFSGMDMSKDGGMINLDGGGNGLEMDMSRESLMSTRRT